MPWLVLLHVPVGHERRGDARQQNIAGFRKAAD
jgi:hypothetical protein